MIYKLLRIACFLALPLYFRFEELSPQPLKDMLSYFLISVFIAELLLLMITKEKTRQLIFFLPLIVFAVSFFPYRSTFIYFMAGDQIIMFITGVLSLLYFIDRRYLYDQFNS